MATAMVADIRISAEDGRFDFWLTAAPLPVTGAVGAPYLVYLLVRTNRVGGSL